MRTPLIAANWKMHSAPTGAFEPSSAYHASDTVDVVVFPTFLDIADCTEAGIVTGGQCGHPEGSGAHTGDISMQMLKDAGCTYVLCGHSERRADHGESDAQVADQANAALTVGLHPVICIGESEAERETDLQNDVISRQLSVLPLNEHITLAYEPIWAIGTGNTATAELAEAMHAFIRSQLPENRRETTRILYGGSMKAGNAGELLAQPNIDGGLVGGASLKPQEFWEIIEKSIQYSV